MVIRRHVAGNFSRSAETYEQAASFQRHAASLLAQSLAAWHPAPGGVSSILELGCGTGFLTRQLLSLFPNARIIATDISGRMLARCSENLAEGETQGRLELLESEAHDALRRYAKSSQLVVAGLVLQWVPDLSAILSLSHELLPPGGQMAFSTLSDATFSSLRNSFAESASAYPGPRLLSLSEIREACSKFPELQISEAIHRQSHPSLREFLRHLQETGAGNASGRPVPPGTLRRIIRKAGVSSFDADYHLLICLCKKGG
ncbi:MAG: hypothetical protein A2X49_05130 [Lentisphaerae bacterium GWF2_52_8]|nr:MAG: hypothetical protein A2X49_05130 [Lentisphaerae bacterium GWF2_52_8]